MFEFPPYFNCKICGRFSDDGAVSSKLCFDCLEADDYCEYCKYNSYDYVCHFHCSGCDGKSKFVKKGC